MLINVITNGLLLTPGGRRSAEAVRPERHQDHARRRPRHAQPHAAAARRPGHLRPDRPQHPAGRRHSAASRSAATSTMDDRRQLPGAARLPPGAGLRRHSCRRWRSSRSSATPRAAGAGRRTRPARRSKFIALTPVSEGKPLGGTCMTSAGAAAASTSACDCCHFVDDQMAFLRDETQEARLPDHRRRPHGAVRDPPPPRPHHRPGRRRSTPARASRATPRSRSATSTAGRSRRGRTRPREFERAGRVEGVRRLRLHSGLRRRLHGRRAHRARRHGRTQLSQGGLEAGLVSLARQAAASAPQPSTSYVTTTRHRTVQEDSMKNEKKQDKKGTLRPWLFDAVVEDLR